jgi:iron complex outermembrane receptor protein
VRVPTRLERDIAIDVTDPAGNPLVRLLGNREFDSERLVAYEAGYRWQATNAVFVDLAAFYNDYSGLASLEVVDPFTDGSGRTIIPVMSRNLTDGHAVGLEALATITPTPWWRLSVSSSTIDLNLDPTGQDRNRGEWYEDATPRHQLGIQLFLDLPAAWQLDARFRHHTSIRRIPVIPTGQGFPEYAQLDVRLAWRGWRQIELSFVGQNLLHHRQTEFGLSSAQAGIERSVYGKVAWGF